MADLSKEVSSIDFGSIIGGSLNAVVDAQSEAAKTTVSFIRSVGFEQTQTEGGVGKPVYVSFKYPKEISPYTPEVPENYTIKLITGGKGYENLKLTFEAGGETLNCDYVTGDDGAIKSITLKTNPTGITGTTTVKIAEADSKTLPTGTDEAKIELVVNPKQEAKNAVYQDMQIEVPLLTMVPIPFIKIAEANIDFNVKISSVTNSQSTAKSENQGSVEASASGGCSFFKASAKMNASFSNQKSATNSEEIKRDYSLNIKIRAVQDDMPAGVEKMLNILEETIVTKTA